MQNKIKKYLKIFTSIIVIVVIIAGSYWQVTFNKDWREQYAYAKGVDAVIYTFPYFLNSALLYKWTSPKTSTNLGPSDAANQFWHSVKLTDPKKYQDGGMPNHDTLYSVTWLYVQDEPIIISIPPIPDNRYYAFEIAGFDSDNYAYIGKRTQGNNGGNYAITPHGWMGVLPDNVTLLAQAPSPWSLILGRTLVDANIDGDLQKVNALQQQYKIVALSDWGKQNPPRPYFRPVDDVGQYSQMLVKNNVGDFIKKIVISDAMAYWQIVNNAMTINGLPEKDHNRLADWSGIKIGPNQNINQTTDSEKSGLKDAVLDGISILKDFGVNGYETNTVNGWNYPAPTTGRSGNHNNFISRAAIQSMKGIIANDAIEAIYIPATYDNNHQRLNGTNDYKIHFTAGNLPPTKEFWSLTMYDATANLIINPINRYAIGNRSKHLIYDNDGGLTIYLGTLPPEGIESNWLPAPDVDFTLILRLYGPSTKVIEQTWIPPTITAL